MTTLETKRRLIEDLELLDYAITKRICTNPEIYPSEKGCGILKTNKRLSNNDKKRILTLQRHETAQFLSKLETERENLMLLMNRDDDDDYDLKNVDYDMINVDSFINKCINLSGSEATNTELKDHQIYDMFSSNLEFSIIDEKIKEIENGQSKRKYIGKNIKDKSSHIAFEKLNILSNYTVNLKIQKLFNINEFKGTLDLKDNFKEYLNLPYYKSDQKDLLNYKTYLKTIHTRNPKINVASPEYTVYLQNLLNYLRTYLRKLNPLTDFQPIDKSLTGFKFPSEFFCGYCNKPFNKESVLNNHNLSKKHKNTLVKAKPNLDLECQIHHLLETALKDEYELTVAEIERFNLLTVREQELEKQDLQKQYNAWTELSSLDMMLNKHERQKQQKESDDELEEDTNPLNLPIGPDGRPMPFWLYKVKGLGHEFKCEICNNEIFKGRQSYIKHFHAEKHIEGLKNLGVTSNYELYSDLSLKDDVLKLQQTLKRKERETVQYNDDLEQVEDEEGNVMNRKVYDQLQKQGLL